MKPIRGSFANNCTGPIALGFRKKKKYTHVVENTKPGTMRIACDFSLQFITPGKNIITKNNLKMYTTFRANRIDKQTLEHATNCYEIIPYHSKATRMVFDIDISKKVAEQLDLPDTPSLVSLYKQELQRLCGVFLNLTIKDEEWRVLISERQDYKRSFHLHLPFHRFVSYQEDFHHFVKDCVCSLRGLCGAIQENGEGLDDGIQTRNRVIRLPYNTKFGVERRLIPVGNHPLRDFFCLDYFGENTDRPIKYTRKTKDPCVPIRVVKSLALKHREEVRQGDEIGSVRFPENWENGPAITTHTPLAFLWGIPSDNHYPIVFSIMASAKVEGISFEDFKIWATQNTCHLCYPNTCSCGRHAINVERWDRKQWDKSTKKGGGLDLLRNIAWAGGRIKTKHKLTLLLEEAFGIKRENLTCVTCRCRFISEAFEGTNLFKKPCLAICSYMKTGKSTLVRSYIEQVPSDHTVIYCASSRSLIYNVASKLPTFTRYNSTNKNHHFTRRLLVTPQSLHRILKRGRVPKNVHFIMDEVESIVQNDWFQKTNKRFGKNCEAMQLLLRFSIRVIAMDAFLSDKSITLLGLSRKHITFVENLWKPSLQQIMYLHPPAKFGKSLLRLKKRIANQKATHLDLEKATSWCKTLQKHLDNGLNLSGPIGSKRVLHHIRDNILGDSFLEFQLRSLTILNDDCIKIVQAFTQDERTRVKIPNLCVDREVMNDCRTLLNEQHIYQNLANKRVFFYTQSVRVGVDYNKKHFHKQFAYLPTGIMTPQDLFQALYRDRQCEMNGERTCDLTIIKSIGISHKPPVGKETLRKQFRGQEFFLRSLLERARTGYTDFLEYTPPPDFRELFIEVLNARFVAQRYPEESLAWWCERAGYDLRKVMATESIPEWAYDFRDKIHKNLEEIPTIHIMQAENLVRRRKQESWAYKKYEFLQKCLPNEDLWEFFIQEPSKFRRAYSILENWAYPEFYFHPFDEPPRFDLTPGQKESLVIYSILKLEPNLLDGGWNDTRIISFLGRYKGQAESCFRIAGKPFTKHVKPLSKINDILNWAIGLKLKRRENFPYKDLVHIARHGSGKDFEKILPPHFENMYTDRTYKGRRKFVSELKRNWKGNSYDLCGKLLDYRQDFLIWE